VPVFVLTMDCEPPVTLASLSSDTKNGNYLHAADVNMKNETTNVLILKEKQRNNKI
jgi:hypothetical protein